MKALIVHNSDEVKACFVGETDEELVEKIMASEYGDDIAERVAQDKEAEDDEDEDEDTPVTTKTYTITVNDIASLYHDGDSVDGFTLIDVL